MTKAHYKALTPIDQAEIDNALPVPSPKNDHIEYLKPSGNFRDEHILPLDDGSLSLEERVRIAEGFVQLMEFFYQLGTMSNPATLKNFYKFKTHYLKNRWGANRETLNKGVNHANKI